MEVTEKMTEFQLEKAATLKTIAIRAKKVGEMVDFYKKVMGFVLKSEENNLSIWGSLLILKVINLRFFTMKQQQIRLLKSNQLCLKILSVRT